MGSFMSAIVVIPMGIAKRLTAITMAKIRSFPYGEDSAKFERAKSEGEKKDIQY